MAEINKIYGLNQSNFFFKKLYEARAKLFSKIINYIPEGSKIIDVGTTPVKDKHENFFLGHYKFPSNITCFSNQNLDILKELYPQLQTIMGDGRDTKLPSNSYDISISNATLEHVGSFSNQIKFVKEMYRIAKKRAIVITPNRFYPIDFHSTFPFIHWLPKNYHRKILKFFKYDFLAEEHNLNLLSKNDLKKICEISNFKNYEIIKMKFYGLTSNLILIINK